MNRSLNARALGLPLGAARTIDLAAAHRFDAVDLLVRDLLAAGDDPREIRLRMDDNGLRGGAWPLPVDWRGDIERFHADLAALPRYAEAAAVLGLTRTGTWVLPEMPDRRRSRAEMVDFHRERLGPIACVLAEHGSRLALEVIGVESFRSGRGEPFVRRMADLQPMLGALLAEIPALAILADAFHLYAAGEPNTAALAWGVDRVAWVHVADLPADARPDRALIRDGDRGLPHENGAVDSAGLLRLLDTAGYQGPVTVETLPGCRSLAGLEPEDVVRRIAAALDGCWPR